MAYKQKSLFVNYRTGFDCGEEYNYNCYLTHLLINANCVNLPFQHECQNIFENVICKQESIPCKFVAAPVKLAARCHVKAEIDYKYDAWPKTAQICDLAECLIFVLFVLICFDVI